MTRRKLPLNALDPEIFCPEPARLRTSARSCSRDAFVFCVVRWDQEGHAGHKRWQDSEALLAQGAVSAEHGQPKTRSSFRIADGAPDGAMDCLFQSINLMQICDVLQVTPAWLFEGAPGPQSKATAAARQMDAAFAAFQADDIASQLMPVWGRLPARIKHLMVALMTAVADETTEHK